MFEKIKQYLYRWAKGHMEKNKIDPYVMEYLLGFLPFFLCLALSVVLVIVLFCLELSGLISIGQVFRFIVRILLSVLLLLFVFIAIEGCLPGIIPGILRDQKQQVRKRVALSEIKSCITIGFCQSIFIGKDHVMDHFFPREWDVVPVNLYCLELKED